ncbi:tRNA-archaeosine synthase [Methanolobus vulcani]|uniref:tRNA-archaeosine synthase n=1 Tax=Methanolobus vulcani TaxID=38026 RepID=A0A7Z7B380_9EURY|nr:archaeosine synthase subunit alpha [Methanolobus vulcani]MDK2947916.1 archaeosine synthase alpha-subunit [Methanolobus sp.]SDG19354.1 tRNA-archaeosine synthase [Methanolobus vulcani]
MTRYFEVQQRDGAARIGKFLLKEDIRTPYILDTRSLGNPESPIIDGGSLWKYSGFEEAQEHLREIRQKAGEDALIILPHQDLTPEAPRNVTIKLAEKAEGMEDSGATGAIYIAGQQVKEHDLYVMEGAGCFENNARTFLSVLLEMKKDIAPDTAIYAPNIAIPENLAMLIYLGIDVFDNTKAIIAGHNDIYLTTAGQFYLDSLAELPCRCSACSSTDLTSLRGMDKKSRAVILEKHNINAMEAEAALVRERIRAGTLREYIEGQCRVHTWLTALMRLTDSEYDFVESQNAIARNNTLVATCGESQNRAEIVRFAKRIQERYTPPESDILLLLPCSARKPYSTSNSHWKFINALGKSRKFVHEVIITSPLGIVPRELELTYPAAHYDTTVTGYWDAEEREWVASCLEDYLTKHKYTSIVAHVEDAYRVICEMVAEKLGIDIIYTSLGNVSSPESLKNLSKTVSELCTGRKRSHEQTQKDLMKAVADYQFGKGSGDILVPQGSTVKGPFPKHQIFVGKKQLITLIPQYGTLAITIEGAKALLGKGRYTVKIDDFVPRGSLLAPGVVDADPLIRPNDEVIICGEKAIAVGRANMNGDEMKRSIRGVAVDLRHVKKIE